MAGFEKQREGLAALGARVVVAASADPQEKAREVAAELSFPVAFGVAREQAETIGAWWDDERGIIQPAEFILRRDGTVMASTYSSGPVGRLDPGDVVRLLDFYESRDREGG